MGTPFPASIPLSRPGRGRDPREAREGEGRPTARPPDPCIHPHPSRFAGPFPLPRRERGTAAHRQTDTPC
ncbi:hypothetical protein [Azospirillum argentinense]